MKEKATLEKAADILNDDGKQLVGRAIYSAAGSIYRAFQSMSSKLKGADSVRNYYIGFAMGMYSNVLRQTLQRLSSIAELSYIGLEVGATGLRPADAPKTLVAHDDKHALLYWDLVWELAAARGMSMEVYQAHPPGCFAPLVGTVEQRTQALRLAKAWRHAIFHPSSVSFVPRPKVTYTSDKQLV